MNQYKAKQKPGQENEFKFYQKHFQFDMVKSIPIQIEKFFELQHFDLDVSAQNSRDSGKTEEKRDSLTELEEDEPTEEKTIAQVSTEEETKDSQADKPEPVEEHKEYQAKMVMMLEMEKLRLITQCCRAGLEEQEVDRILHEENVPDYDFENFKLRMGKKLEKKTYG